MEVLVLSLIFILWLLIPSRIYRGWLGEAKTTFKMWLTLDSKIYHKFHNVIIPSKNGTAQIDHLLVSPFGIFIVETKNIKGWIFGSEQQANWTQSLRGKNFSFQNPVRQTFRQKRVLAEYLKLDERLIHTVVYFVGHCTFKTRLPSNVIKHGLCSHIHQYQNHVLSSEKMGQIIERLKELRSDPALTTRNHVKSLRKRHNSSSTCPKCGAQLVERTAKQGSNVGNKFLGCRNYPRCKFTKSVS